MERTRYTQQQRKRKRQELLKKGKPWTKDEEEKVVRLRDEGYSYVDIGLEVGRTQYAIAQRISTLSLQKNQKEKDVKFGIGIVKEPNYEIGKIYFIDTIRTWGLDFLPAKYKLVKKQKSVEGKILYVFESIRGLYKLCFTYNQLVSSYKIKCCGEEE